MRRDTTRKAFSSNMVMAVALVVAATNMVLVMIFFQITNGAASYYDMLEAKTGNSGARKEAKTGGSYEMAFRQSLGFFDDVPESDWIRQKQISEKKVHVGPIQGMIVAREIYQYVWESDFSCRHEVMVGPMEDGHKWVCDPHRLERIHDERMKEKGEGCLIYSIGCNGIFTFEEAILEIMPFCEIVLVDPHDYSADIPAAIKDRVTYHTNALDASARKFQQQKFNNAISLPELMEKNGHTNRTVDIFKIDCEGCEWAAYHDLLKTDLRQILVEVHRWTLPQSPLFFQAMYDHGYAIFHKESNTFGCSGNCLEYSFIKLGKSYQTVDQAIS
jgi:hypothetical protein